LKKHEINSDEIKGIYDKAKNIKAGTNNILDLCNYYEKKGKWLADQLIFEDSIELTRVPNDPGVGGMVNYMDPASASYLYHASGEYKKKQENDLLAFGCGAASYVEDICDFGCGALGYLEELGAKYSKLIR